MYEVSWVIVNLESHLVLALILTGVIWAAGLVQISSAVLVGERDKFPAVPAVTTAFLFAHDLTYVLNFNKWFYEVDHWYFKVFWFGMVGAVVIEIMLIIQFLRYGHQRIAPQLSKGAFVGCFLTMQTLTLVMLWWLQSVLDDPLRLITMTATSIFQVVALVPWIISRGNAFGQSMTFAVAGLIGPGSIGMFLLPVLVPSFSTPLFYAMVALMAAVSVLYILLLIHYRRADQAKGATAEMPEGALVAAR